jgi:hypothetical protein
MKKHLPIKATFLYGLILLTAACETTVPTDKMNALMRSQNFVPYIPPQGNPGNYAGWNTYGPGVLMEAKTYNAQRYAERNLGSGEVRRIMTDANDPAKRTPFGALSNKRTSGNDFDASGGWSFAAAAKVKASLHLNNATTVDIKFGNTWISAPLDYDGFKSALQHHHAVINQATQKRLSSGRSQFVFKTIYTDSITIYFKVTRGGGGDVALQIPKQDEDKLGGHYTVDSDGGVTISGPIIIGYVPVPRDALAQVLP